MSENQDGLFQNSTRWRREFAEFLQVERKKKAKIATAQKFPKPGTQKQAESKKKRAVNELDYVLRFLMWLLSEKHQPSVQRLRCLVIAWFLAKVEYTTEQASFQETIAEDFGNEFGDLESTDAIFREAWEKYGTTVQSRLEETFSPIYESLLTESEQEAADPQSNVGTAHRLPTVDRFPEAFSPLAVIVGGYGGDINKEPEHIYELFRQSQSLVNLHYLPHLNLDPSTQIISDQLFIELDDDQRASEVLGNHHLLVIGGPLVNAVSRHLTLTKQLAFNFTYDSPTYRWEKGVYDFLTESGLFKNALSVKMLFRMLEIPHDILEITRPEFVHEDIDPAVVQEIKNMVFKIRHDFMGNLSANNRDISEQFRPQKIFSPLDPKLRSCVNDNRHERAIISLGENPWSKRLRKKNPTLPRYEVIVVAGINPLSTAIAVKALSKKGNFVERPLGGLLDIIEDRRHGEYKRVIESTYDWLTTPYEVKDILTSIDHALAHFDERPNSFTLFNTSESLRSYREIIEHYS
jgi:hypothetical protein